MLPAACAQYVLKKDTWTIAEGSSLLESNNNDIYEMPNIKMEMNKNNGFTVWQYRTFERQTLKINSRRDTNFVVTVGNCDCHNNNVTTTGAISHDDVMKWKHFPRHWPFVRGIHRSSLNSPQRPVTWSFDVFFDLRLNQELSKQWRRRWFEAPSRSLWRHCNVAAKLASRPCSVFSKITTKRTPITTHLVEYCPWLAGCPFAPPLRGRGFPLLAKLWRDYFVQVVQGPTQSPSFAHWYFHCHFQYYNLP